MHVDITSGLLTQAAYHCSPNYDERPDSDDISGIVIHSISLPPGKFGGGWIDDLFMNKLEPSTHPYFQDIAHLKVSAHLLIRRTGDIIQYVPFHKRAWHAGVSCWDGRECCNDFTVGIELEGCDDQPFEKQQYRVLAETIIALTDTYRKLTLDRVVGHCDIAPGRKTDPGPYFDWKDLKRLLTQ